MLRASFIKAILAGGAVGIGGAVFLSCDDKAIGAFFFSVALLTVCWMGLNLFTGKVGFMVESHKNSDWLNLLMALIGNAVGACGCGFLISKGVNNVVEKCSAICEAKLAQTLPDALIRAFFCGILMYTAVWIFREKKTIAGILFCIPVFILSGFEHSIADMFYFTVAGNGGSDAIFYLTYIVLGNAVGGVFIPFMMLLCKEGGTAK
ncbi:MAG: formate/nitrite transporter family protein [Ruminococcaceae bacterium]|nr:formate/nitrite transporter family protein [Oscillospiraceae bacterium]